ncbi:unnamed protein product [Prorocentrum cordatum]|uniref:Uncharacterized protein n=1 Tax=Prorocentrum cordatum TaxID=2364126 RepID=A0ABN9R5Z3_9DINO|nr:unnamed protein product [Polarella glacialis]
MYLLLLVNRMCLAIPLERSRRPSSCPLEIISRQLLPNPSDLSPLARACLPGISHCRSTRLSTLPLGGSRSVEGGALSEGAGAHGSSAALAPPLNLACSARVSSEAAVFPEIGR